MTRAAATTVGEGYGGFQLGEMQLALPMAALREVLSRGDLTALPCAAASVIGGIDIRGVLVPVLDLGVLLGRGRAEAPYPCVVVMVHGGRLLGLLADRVTGVFTCAAGGVTRLSIADGSRSVLEGSLHRSDEDTFVNLLSPAALAALPQVPMIDDPELSRAVVTDAGSAAELAERPMTALLLQCARVRFAIDATAVEATLADPSIDASALAMGACRGRIRHAGRDIPAVDLLELCGLGRLDPSASAHAFVLGLEAGSVALLVGEVIDVVRTRAAAIVALPACALPEPALFGGTMPASALGGDVPQSPGAVTAQYLVLDPAAMRASQVLQALAATGIAVGDAGSGSARPGGARERAQAPLRTMITYDAFGETATPMDQVAEILRFDPDAAIVETDGPRVALMVNRSRSIPVFCLRRLAGAPPVRLTADCCVLVVRIGDEYLGLAVSGVRSIESARWEPVLPSHGLGEHDSLTHVLGSRALALVGAGEEQRMLRVLDLERVARSLRVTT